jgi:hypothetical protein
MTRTVDTPPTLAATGVLAVTRAQMREVDRVMTDELGISLVQMMENAGLQLADLVRRLLASTFTGRALYPRLGLIVPAVLAERPLVRLLY